ncbi:MAG: low affinity iron permease family protein [Granulicella sp.]
MAVGPIFHFPDTWQSAINTRTAIVTFWMVSSSRTLKIEMHEQST